MVVQNRFKWLGVMALSASGVAACSGADVSSEDPAGTSQAELHDGKICNGLGCTPTPKPRPIPTFCGGIAGVACPKGQSCVDNPNDSCDPNHGGADCGGICVADAKPTFCGGIAGVPCEAGQVCVDDPSDDCDVKHGGSDCGGICVPVSR